MITVQVTCLRIPALKVEINVKLNVMKSYYVLLIHGELKLVMIIVSHSIQDLILTLMVIISNQRTYPTKIMDVGRTIRHTSKQKVLQDHVLGPTVFRLMQEVMQIKFPIWGDKLLFLLKKHAHRIALI